MTHASNTLTGLVLIAAAALVTAASMNPYPPSGLSQTRALPVASKYPHNINPDPHGPYYFNPYDPYQMGFPENVTPPVLGVAEPSDGEPLHPPNHH